MTPKALIACRNFSLFAAFTLLLQFSTAQSKFAKVDAWLKENAPALGGRVVLQVYKDGKIVYTGTENNLSTRQKMVGKFIAKRSGKNASEMLNDFTPQSKELIASSSKWLSAALVMTFVDEGKLKLEDTIGKYLPVMTKHGKGNIRVWQCLSHLTGIKAEEMKDNIKDMRNIQSMDDAMQKIAELPMEGEPGKTFHYSSVGLQIAGSLLEKISGKNFGTLFLERIATPCNMKNTDFGKAKVPNPAGSGNSTTEDYMHFLEMILHDGKFNGKQVLSKNSVIKMQQNYAKGSTIASSPAQAGDWGYGFGEWVMEDADVRSKAVSSPGLFGSFPWVDNSRKYAAFLLCLNLKQQGRNAKYKELKALVDEALN